MIWSQSVATRLAVTWASCIISKGAIESMEEHLYVEAEPGLPQTGESLSLTDVYI